MRTKIIKDTYVVINTSNYNQSVTTLSLSQQLIDNQSGSTRPFTRLFVWALCDKHYIHLCKLQLSTNQITARYMIDILTGDVTPIIKIMENVVNVIFKTFVLSCVDASSDESWFLFLNHIFPQGIPVCWYYLCLNSIF